MWSVLCFGLSLAHLDGSIPSAEISKSLSKLDLGTRLNLRVSDAAHPNHQTGVPDSFADVDELKEYLKSSEGGKAPIALFPDNKQWNKKLVDALLQEINTGQSKLELFPSDDGGKKLARVISIINIRVYNSDVEGGYYLVDVRSTLPPNTGKHSEKGAFPKVGWKLLAGPMEVGEEPLAAAAKALEASGVDGGASESLHFLGVMSTEPQLQQSFGLVAPHQLQLAEGIPACPDMYPDVSCIMQVYLFETKASGLAPPPEFLKTTKSDGSGIFWTWEQLEDMAPSCERRRLHEMAITSSENEWHQEWTERFECYWLALPGPTQMQLGGCLGALALHLGSRFDRMLGRPTTPAAGARDGVRAEGGCEWLDESQFRELPTLPDFPRVGSFEFTIPPIPRLVPTWQRLHSLAPLSGSHAERPTSATTVLFFGVGGGLIGSLMISAFVGGRKRSIRPQLRRDVPAESLEKAPVEKAPVQMSR